MTVTPSPISHRKLGFTLIELIVVIGIIVLLIAFLVPAISVARNSSRRTATTAQLRSISLACDSYYTTFNAYPGAISESLYAGAALPPFTSSQALEVSLTRAFFTASQNAATPPIPTVQVVIPGLPAAFWVSTNASVSPRDYSTGGAAGKTYEAFLNPKPNELSTSIGLTDATLGLQNIPTFVDAAYGNDSLPILYYRAARKYDASVTDPANPGNVMLPVLEDVAHGYAAFYSASNDFLASGTSTQTYSNSGIKNLNAGTAAGKANLTSLLFNTNSNGTVVAKGSYVLISASTDRTYGADPKGNVDDIIVAGGN